MEDFDQELLKYETGIRAVWLLYRWGKWGWLEDLGIIRQEVEPAFEEMETRVIRDRLTRLQVDRFAMIPGVREAARELQLAYALKFYDRRKEAHEILSRAN